MKDLLFTLLAGRFGRLVGRRNLVRAGSFLARAGRQDIPNRISTNGEALLQKDVLTNAEGDNLVVIDCGANRGQWSRQLTSTARDFAIGKRLRVYCFEPSSYTFAQLIAEIPELQSTTAEFLPIQKALSSKPGELALKIVHDGAGTNSLVSVSGRYGSEEMVQVTSLDQFVIDNAIARVNLLKIDAEGHDLDVILGAEHLLSEQRIDVIQFEYNWRWIYGGRFLKNVYDLITPYGYRVGKLTPLGVQVYPQYDIALESFVEGNYVAFTDAWESAISQTPSWLA